MGTVHGGVFRRTQSRSGAALALVVVFLMSLLGVFALVTDVGSLMTAHAEAQRVADAAALAAARAYLDFVPADSAVGPGRARAFDFALRQGNVVRGQALDSADVSVQMDPNAFTATVWVRSNPILNKLAGILGVPSSVVSARATAWAAPAGGATCVKPFAIPDLWSETDVTNQDNDPTDRRWSSTEGWDFEPGAGDRYEKWVATTPNSTTATGYGSQWRNVIGTAPPYDLGMILTVKSQRPGTNITNGFFYPWRIGTSSGANDYRANIETCNPTVSATGVPYPIEAGNMVGPTRAGIQTLLSADASAQWDQATLSVINSNLGANWRSSPRVFIAGLFDPNQLAGVKSGGNLDIVFNDWALFFLEGFDPTWSGPPPQAPVQARLIGFAPGTAQGPGAGQLSRLLRLIE